MTEEVKHRDLKDHLPCTYHIQHILKKFYLGVKEAPAFTSIIFMEGDHCMEKIYSKVSRWQQWETERL